MTARELLNRRRRWTGRLLLVGVVVFVAGIAGSAAVGWPGGIAVAAPGVVMMMAAGVTQGFAVRCPWCRENLGIFLNRGGALMKVDPKLRYCPYCGASLDADPDPGDAPKEDAGW